MKYFLYISDTKLDMMYSQIPRPLRDKVATELKIDLKFLSTTLSEAPSEETRYSKLAVVQNYIEKNESVGTVDKPATFIKSTMPLRWAVGHSEALRMTGFDKIGSLVFFAGETDQTILVMGGSQKHIIGEGPSAQDVGPVVTSMTLRDVFYELFNQDLRSDEKPGRPADTAFVANVAKLSEIIPGPAQTMEFLAKRVNDGDMSGKHVLLVSPIYVAHND